MKNKLPIKIASLFLIFFVGACDSFVNHDPSAPAESIKDIDGTWKIIQATRNGVDITDLMDFTKFRIRFGSDNSYTIEHYLPFIVQSKGKWSFDDPQYPFNLNLTEDGSGETVTTAFNYPVVNGVRKIALSFSPGCVKNNYTYLFEKETTTN